MCKNLLQPDCLLHSDRSPLLAAAFATKLPPFCSSRLYSLRCCVKSSYKRVHVCQGGRYRSSPPLANLVLRTEGRHRVFCFDLVIKSHSSGNLLVQVQRHRSFSTSFQLCLCSEGAPLRLHPPPIDDYLARAAPGG